MRGEPGDGGSRSGGSPRAGWGRAEPREQPIPVPEALGLLERFASTQAMTAGVGAMIAETGCYLAPSAVGEVLDFEPYRIWLRLNPLGMRAVLVDEGGGGCYLELRSRIDRVMHRARPVFDADARLIRERIGAASPASPRDPHAGGAAVYGEQDRVGARLRVLQERTTAGDQLAQLDSALVRGGRERHLWLREQAAERTTPLEERGARREPDPVRRTDARLIPALFEHLCSTELPVGVAVFSSDAVQLAIGRTHFVSGSDHGHLEIGMDTGTLGFDLCVLHECLVVRCAGPHGATSALELYDIEGEIIAMIGQFGVIGADAHRRWELLSESLPECGM